MLVGQEVEAVVVGLHHQNYLQRILLRMLKQLALLWAHLKLRLDGCRLQKIGDWPEGMIAKFMSI